MKNKDLIDILKTFPPDLDVIAAGECADKVELENCGEYSYLRIFEPWDCSFISSQDIIGDDYINSKEEWRF